MTFKLSLIKGNTTSHNDKSTKLMEPAVGRNRTPVTITTYNDQRFVV